MKSLGQPHLRGNTGRRSAIRKLIRGNLISTQGDLRRLLVKEGFKVTQATLSRDLARLSARRVPRAGGGTAYELEDSRIADGPDNLAAVSELVVSVDDNERLIVVTTVAGAASAVAVAIDRARLPEILGTLAGDDTIFIAPARKVSAMSVTQKLNFVWMKANNDS